MVPSKIELLNYLLNLDYIPSKNEVCRAFSVKKDKDRLALKRLLKDLDQKESSARPRKKEVGSKPLPIKVLLNAPLVGQVSKTDNGIQFVPLHRKVKETFAIENVRSLKESHIGQVFEATLIKENPPTVKLGNQLGSIYDISLISAHIMNIPMEFSSKTLNESKDLKIPALGDREDIRQIPLVTIDGKDSRDFDDAVWAEPDSNPQNKKGWHLIVAIADVAHYVSPGSALDTNALERGTSVYFPDRVIPMLPEELSNGVCSLNPLVDRACLGVHIWIDKDGNKLDHRFFRGLMKSAARLTYESVQSDFDSKAVTPIQSLIQNLYGAYFSLKKAREVRQTLDIEIAEPLVILDSNGKIKEFSPRPRLASHQLIEEFMVLANVAAAETLEKNKIPCLYRVHATPDAEKILDLTQTLKQLGIHYKKSLKTAGDLSALLHFSKDSPYYYIINQLVLRCQSQAVYTYENIGHFGLSLQHYCHFTSPIRRYPDLLIHRALISTLQKNDTIIPPNEESLDALAQVLSQAERRAVSAERDAMDRYMTCYMSEQVGETFEAFVTGISQAGLFIHTLPNYISGLVPMNQLKDDYYVLKTHPARLEGRRTKKVYRFGTSLSVKLKEADLTKGRLAYELVTKK